ncbi:MAG TPA: hypothetical protein VIS51_11850 [Solirubrobacterales bacterium]
MIDLRPSFERFDAPDKGSALESSRMLEELWGEVAQEIGVERFKGALGTVRHGKRFNKTYDHAWAQTHGEKTENTANLTLEISAGELSLNLVGFYNEQFEKVRDWIRGKPGRNFLKSHPELILVIFVRTAQKGKGGRSMWKGAESDELQRLTLSEASPSDVTMRLSTLSSQIDPDTQKLGLHVRRTWSREEALAMSDVSEIASLVEDWMAEIGTVEVGNAPRSW